MIARLLELRLSAFRAFREEQVIPLNADIILIYGTNGTAKTSLLAGLEFALTGSVCDLRAFGKDYPRCLQHLGASENSSATVRFLDTESNEQEITHSVSTTGGTSQSPITLTPEERCFFIDRCYLSQSSLSRLLENYQASNKEQPEQPLVRFVRELLGLDLLENLTSGLYEAGNILRIEKSVPPLREARETQTRTAQQMTELVGRRDALVRGWQASLTELQQVAGEVGDIAPEAPWDLAGIDLRLKAMDENGHDRATAEQLKKLRYADGLLQRSLGLLGDREDAAMRSRTQQQLQLAESELASLERRLTELVTRVHATLPDWGMQPPASDNLASALQAAVSMLGEARDRLMIGERHVAKLRADLLRLRGRADELVAVLSSHSAPASGEIVSRQRLAELLSAIVNYVHADECPVCRRDYAELESGSLVERILSEISMIGADSRALEEKEQRRTVFELEHQEIKRGIAALEENLAQVQPATERDGALGQAMGVLLTECVNAEPDRQAILRIVPAITGYRAQLATMDTRSIQRGTASVELKRLAYELGLDIPIDCETEQIGERVASHLSTAIQKTEGQLTGVNRLRTALDVAKNAGRSLLQLDLEMAAARLGNERATALVQKMSSLIQEGRDLAKAATNAKKKLLDQVFNDALNGLWQDFFGRLAKHERFRPWLSEPISERGQIRTTIEGRAAIGAPFSQFAAVASSGNVSTAALSLFLALHLIEQPRHRVLILDDPVQNMDDVHIVQLASLLRKIGRSAERQIVIAVHERALFDYLCLELSPTQPKGKLLAIELRRERPDEAPTVNWTEHIWKGDQLKFGESA